jgi:hypothetical protein
MRQAEEPGQPGAGRIISTGRATHLGYRFFARRPYSFRIVSVYPLGWRAPRKMRSRAASNASPLIGGAELPVDDIRHPQQRGVYLLPRHYPMQQPVGDMLRADPQSSAILHLVHIMDVRYFRTPETLIDPSSHVAEDALRIVVQRNRVVPLSITHIFACQNETQLDVCQAC